MLREYEGKLIYLVGDGYDVARRGLEAEGIDLAKTPPLLINASAYSIARVALRKYERGEYEDDKSISPIYLRLPQAERELKIRKGESKCERQNCWLNCWRD